MARQPKGPPLSKAELRAQAELAMATAAKPIVKLPTKLVRQCGRCGETNAVMVEPGEAPPPFHCKHCDGPGKRKKASAKSETKPEPEPE